MTNSTTAAALDPDRGLSLRGVSKDLGGRRIVDTLDLDVEAGEMVAVLGPSGCGKTTTLRVVAGFLTPDAGQVLIGGRDYSAAPPERRPTAMVFQNYALWPHMSVFKNVAFPLKLRRLPRAEIRDRVENALEIVNLIHHRNSRPAQISGGEQQRTALARALVQEPQLLLLDEPLSNLDAKLRGEVREDIRRIQQDLGITTVVVTHDQDEALSISDRVAVMNGGRIEQFSEPARLYRQPQTEFVGAFIGTMSRFPGAIEHEDSGWVARLGEGAEAVRVGCLRPSVEESTQSAEVVLGVRPEDVQLTASPRTGSVPGRVLRAMPKGHLAEILISVGAHQLRTLAETGLHAAGETVYLSLDRVLVYLDGELQTMPAPAPGMSTDQADEEELDRVLTP